MQFRNKKGNHRLLRYITFESVVVDVEHGRHTSIKRSLHECGRDN